MTLTINGNGTDLDSMLFYTARLTLCRLSLKECCTLTAPPESRKGIFSKCDDYIEAVTCITRRFRAQHTLRTASLFFIQGIITAADTILALGHLQPDLGRKHLPFLASALREMGKTWRVAADAEIGLKQTFSLHMMQQPTPPSSAETDPQNCPSKGLPSPSAEGIPPLGDAEHTQNAPMWLSTDQMLHDPLAQLDFGYDGGNYREEDWLAYCNGPQSNNFR